MKQKISVSTIKGRREKHEKIDGKLKFLPGEHIISVPFSRDMIENNDFEVHKGYEPIGIAKAMAGKNFAGFAGGCILYINTETVLCTKDENNVNIHTGSAVLYVNIEEVTCKKTEDNKYTEFGTPKEEVKVNIK